VIGAFIAISPERAGRSVAARPCILEKIAKQGCAESRADPAASHNDRTPHEAALGSKRQGSAASKPPFAETGPRRHRVPGALHSGPARGRRGIANLVEAKFDAR
jgi:hypothetical protein